MAGSCVAGQVGRFRVLEVLARDARRDRFVAHDPALDRHVVLDVLHVRAGEARAWLHAARAMARIEHPNVVTVHEAGLVEGRPYLVLERVAGSSLAAWLAAAPRSWQDVLAVLIPVGEGLAAAHRIGLAHGEITSHSVLVGADGRPRLVDFGQAGLEVDPRDDQAGFCALLRHALRDPSQALPGAAWPRVPPRIERAIQRGLAASSEDRWPTLEDLLAALRPARPGRALAIAGAVAVAMTAVATLSTRSSPARLPTPRLVPITQRGDLQAATISPDGAQLALVVGDSLVVRSTARDAEERVVLDHGVRAVLGWSPDATRALISMAATGATPPSTAVVELGHGARTPVPGGGLATFLSNTEIAVTTPRARAADILAISGVPAPVARCDVPGDYQLIEGLGALSDGALVVRTSNGARGMLVILARDCRVLGSYAAAHLTDAAVTDTGTALALIDGDGFVDLIEVSREGTPRSRRRISGELAAALGRRNGTDYLLKVALRTYLDQVHGASPPVHVFSSLGMAAYALAPRGDALAWIELGTRPRGPLRVSTVRDLAVRGRPLLDHAVRLAWSPDGAALAALVDDEQGAGVVVVARDGRTRRRLPLARLHSPAQPVWLSEHRVAAQADDRITYRWFDLASGAHGELPDRAHAGTYWLDRSPRDGTLAMWRSGMPGATGRDAEHVWLIAPGQPPAPLHVAAAAVHELVPTWSPTGDLLVRARDTGAVSRVALDTGRLEPVAQLAPDAFFDDHLGFLADGDLLVPAHEVRLDVVAASGE